MTPSRFDGLSMEVNDGDRWEKQGFGDGVDIFSKAYFSVSLLKDKCSEKLMYKGRRRSGLFYFSEKPS